MPELSELIRSTADADETVRERAVSDLEGCGPPPKGELSLLIELLDSPDEAPVYWAITLIGRLQREAVPATEKLASVLATAKSSSVRQRAAWALGEIEVFSDEVRAKLVAAADDADPRLARLATRALQQ